MKPGLQVQLAPQLSLTHLPPFRQVKFLPHCSGGNGHLGKVRDSLVSDQFWGKVKVHSDSVEAGLARVISTVIGISRKEFDTSGEGNSLRNYPQCQSITLSMPREYTGAVSVLGLFSHSCLFLLMKL